MTKIIVLAAGQGKRMGGNEPKVLIKINGKSIIQYLTQAIEKSHITAKPVVVVGQGADQIKKVLGDSYDYVLQKEQLGTGHAVACCKEFLKDKADDIMVLYGDHPFVAKKTIHKLKLVHQREKTVMTMMTTYVQDFKDWRAPLYDFGRVIRDGEKKIIDIVEFKDATEEQKKIHEVNPSFFCFKANWLWHGIDQLKNDNVQKEYYLTDMAKIAFRENQKISSIQIDPLEALGLNTPEQLELAKELMNNNHR